MPLRFWAYPSEPPEPTRVIQPHWQPHWPARWATMLMRNATEADIPEIQSIYAHHVLHGTGTCDEGHPRSRT